MNTHPQSLDSKQRQGFLDSGFMHCAGVVSPERCRAAEAALWRTTGLDPEDPAGWPQGWQMPKEAYELEEVQACGTSELRAAVDGLVGEGCWEWGPFGVGKPAISVIIIFPHRNAKRSRSPLELRDETRPEYVHFYPHVDQYSPVTITLARPARRALSLLRRLGVTRYTHPGELSTFVLNIMVLLHDVPAEHGATLLWPGSYRAVQEASNRLGLRPAEVVNKRHLEPAADYHEAVGGIGDAVLYTRNLIHSPSMNMSTRPRVALQIPVHLNRRGWNHCRRSVAPRTPVEQIYDEHMAQPGAFEYFCF